MSYRDVYIAERTMELQEKEAPRRAARQRLLRQAGTERPGWLFYRRCWLLCQLGRLLVATGQRLEQARPPRPVTAGG